MTNVALAASAGPSERPDVISDTLGPAGFAALSSSRLSSSRLLPLSSSRLHADQPATPSPARRRRAVSDGAPAATTRSAPHRHMGRRPQGRRPEAADGPTAHGAASAAPRTSRRVPGARHPARATTHPFAASRTDVRGGAHGDLTFVARAFSRAALLRSKRSRAPDRRGRGHTALSVGIAALKIRVARGSIACSGAGAPSGQTVTMPVPCVRPARWRGLLYVLQNWKKHIRHVRGLDGRSSAAWFDGWAERPTSPADPSPVAAPRTWLAATGWRRCTVGPLRKDEAPQSAPDGSLI